MVETNSFVSIVFVVLIYVLFPVICWFDLEKGTSSQWLFEAPPRTFHLVKQQITTNLTPWTSQNHVLFRFSSLNKYVCACYFAKQMNPRKSGLWHLVPPLRTSCCWLFCVFLVVICYVFHIYCVCPSWGPACVCLLLCYWCLYVIMYCFVVLSFPLVLFL